MNVANNNLENASHSFKKCFSSLFSHLNIQEMTYTVINTVEGSVLTLPTDYEWHLKYWYSGLDLELSERCRIGIHSWNEYSDPHQAALSKGFNQKSIKMDICTKRPDGYEIFSISSNQKSTINLALDIPKLKAVVGDYINKQRRVWKDDMLLPLRNAITLKENKKIENFISESPYMFFSGVRLTVTEMDTIKLLLQLKSTKEIAAIHDCSVTAEKNRINAIKKKLGCENQSSSSLYSALHSKGITLACLDSYTTSQ